MNRDKTVRGAALTLLAAGAACSALGPSAGPGRADRARTRRAGGSWPRRPPSLPAPGADAPDATPLADALSLPRPRN